MGESLPRSEVIGRLTASVILWLHAAERQKERTMDRSAKREHRISDALFFVMAIRNVRLALNRLVKLDAAPGYGDAIRAIFDKAVPSIDQLRHTLEHSDEYFLGTGKAQRKGTFSQWKIDLEDLDGETVISIGELSVKVGEAYVAGLKAFQQLCVVFQEILKWPEDIQQLS